MTMGIIMAKTAVLIDLSMFKVCQERGIGVFLRKVWSDDEFLRVHTILLDDLEAKLQENDKNSPSFAAEGATPFRIVTGKL